MLSHITAPLEVRQDPLVSPGPLDKNHGTRQFFSESESQEIWGAVN